MSQETRTELQRKVHDLQQAVNEMADELDRIANISTKGWEDPTDFEGWARSRAQYTFDRWKDRRTAAPAAVQAVKKRAGLPYPSESQADKLVAALRERTGDGLTTRFVDVGDGEGDVRECE